MRLAETTNGKLSDVKAGVATLIEWADADAEHSAENDAKGVATDDKRRARNLRAALDLLDRCYR